jgi:hypothetical protein
VDAGARRGRRRYVVIGGIGDGRPWWLSGAMADQIHRR